MACRLLIFLLIFPTAVWAQRKSKQTEYSDPPAGTNLISVHFERSRPEAYRVLLRMLDRAHRPLESTDSIRYIIVTDLFSISSGYDLKMILAVKEGLVELRGESFNRAGLSHRAACHVPAPGASLAFNHLNYFALSLSAELRGTQIRYLKDEEQGR